MSYALKGKRRQGSVSRRPPSAIPQTIDVVKTRRRRSGIEVRVFELRGLQTRSRRVWGVGAISGKPTAQSSTTARP